MVKVTEAELVITEVELIITEVELIGVGVELIGVRVELIGVRVEQYYDFKSTVSFTATPMLIPGPELVITGAELSLPLK